jgi:RHS repeat-associated protein
LTETNTYNNRMRLTSEMVGPSGSAYSLALGYAPNGDVLTGFDSANGNWTYTYDDFNRMVTSSETSPQTAYSYGYDRFGNRWSQTVTAGSGYNSSLTFDANNHFYENPNGIDIAGDVDIADTGFGTNYTFNYFGDNNLDWVWNGSSHVAYFHYDGLGRRTEKVSGSSIYYYYHDLAGHEVAVMDQNGNWIRGEVYAGGKHLATYVGGTSGTTYFDHGDQVGTGRARTTATGGGAETCQSLPFGDGQSCSGSDISPLHFMDKERDPESNLDDFGARFYSSTYGRWMSPDWSESPEPVPYADLTNPQSLNLYALVRGNPETFADLDGHDPLPGTNSGGNPDTNSLDACSGLWNRPCYGFQPGVADPNQANYVEQTAEQRAQQDEKSTQPTVNQSLDYVAKTALEEINPTSISEDREYAARAYKNPDGTYSVTDFNPGTKASSMPPPVSSLPPVPPMQAASIHTGATIQDTTTSTFPQPTSEMLAMTMCLRILQPRQGEF